MKINYEIHKIAIAVSVIMNIYSCDIIKVL